MHQLPALIGMGTISPDHALPLSSEAIFYGALANPRIRNGPELGLDSRVRPLRSVLLPNDDQLSLSGWRTLVLGRGAARRDDMIYHRRPPRAKSSSITTSLTPGTDFA